MNSFEGFALSGANITRYVPMYGNASGIIGAYRKYAEPHKKYEIPPLGIGQTPLFLLDGELTGRMLNTAKERLGLTTFVAIYRPFDVKTKKRMEDLYKKCLDLGFIKKDGSIATWIQEDRHRAETISDDYVKERLNAIQPYMDYEKAREEYNAAIAAPLIDATTGQEVMGDLNEYLYNRAKVMFPLGVESILKTNIKQSAIPKCQYFVDGLGNAPAPKGVRQYGLCDKQINLFEIGKVSIDDTIEVLSAFLRVRLQQDGVVRLDEIITYCAEIGLPKGNIALYVMGAAIRDLVQENMIYCDGVCYWRYAEVQDISSWILRVYERIERRRVSDARKAALFIDNTMLKQRLESIFGMEPTEDKRLDTLGMAITMISAWIAENLRYPIAFLDDTLYRLLRENDLYGEKLMRYSTYFTEKRCEWLKTQLPHAEAIARRAVKEAVGYDPDTTTHRLSDLPKGHFASVLYSAEDYIGEIQRRPRWA